MSNSTDENKFDYKLGEHIKTDVPDVSRFRGLGGGARVDLLLALGGLPQCRVYGALPTASRRMSADHLLASHFFAAR